MILSDEYSKLVVEDTETGEEIAVITKEGVTTAGDGIVVRLTPSADIQLALKADAQIFGKVIRSAIRNHRAALRLKGDGTEQP